jgi:hypothetical protein
VLPEPTAVTLKVIDALEVLGIRYLISGSFASSIHGVARMTADVDLVVDLEMDQVDPFPHSPLRRPRVSQRSYCLACRKGKIPQRDAMRDSRHRARKESERS